MKAPPAWVYGRLMVRCDVDGCEGEGSVLVWGNAQTLTQPDIGWTGPASMCEQHVADMASLGAIVRAEYPDGRTLTP